jgi:hypothetical protein
MLPLKGVNPKINVSYVVYDLLNVNKLILVVLCLIPLIVVVDRPRHACAQRVLGP